MSDVLAPGARVPTPLPCSHALGTDLPADPSTGPPALRDARVSALEGAAAGADEGVAPSAALPARAPSPPAVPTLRRDPEWAREGKRSGLVGDPCQDPAPPALAVPSTAPLLADTGTRAVPGGGAMPSTAQSSRAGLSACSPESFKAVKGFTEMRRHRGGARRNMSPRLTGTSWFGLHQTRAHATSPHNTHQSASQISHDTMFRLSHHPIAHNSNAGGEMMTWRREAMGKDTAPCLCLENVSAPRCG